MRSLVSCESWSLTYNNVRRANGRIEKLVNTRVGQWLITKLF